MRLLAIFVLALVPMVPVLSGFSDEKPEAKELQEELERLVEEKQWSKAESVAKKLRRHVDPEARPELDARVRHFKGQREYEKLAKATSKPKNPQKAFQKIERFLTKYAKDGVLVAQARELRRSLRERLYHVFNDFERAPRKSGAFVAETNPTRIKHGSSAVRWKSKTLDYEFAFVEGSADWTQYSHLVFWMYGNSSSGRIAVQLYCKEWTYFEHYINIKPGWQLVRLPLRDGRKGFRRHQEAEWKDVKNLRLCKEKGTEIDIVLDDVRLERKR